ncbi:MAG TPA: hypothetical protein EYQ42_05665 [Thiotrichaceae bacterium]|nr:hypothetical protein [Thiotrichaceae bacterium]HIM07859.1 hypothetical protein [Gammaproteobacteria bacterium]
MKSVADEISEHGVFSFLLSDSKNMYAYCTNRMCWVTRQYPFGEAHLIDTGETIDFNTRLDKDDVITIIASHSLTDNEQWNCMEKGEFRVFSNGKSSRLAT